MEDQRLLLSGVDLEDEDCLSKAGVLDEATLQVAACACLSMLGS